MRSALFAAALTVVAGPAAAQFALPNDFVDEFVIGGLSESVGMAMLPDGRLFVIERVTARIRLVVNGALAAVDPVTTVPDLDADYAEEGLLGVAVDPGWPTRPYVYVQYTVSGAAINRIARFAVTGDLTFAGNGALAIDPATRYDVLEVPRPVAFHNGGTLRFGPDGMLYSSIGDYSLCGAQTLADLLGKILRLDVSALPPGPGGPAPKALITPPDNPFVADPSPDARLVWQWGLRNPFRFGIDPQTGEMMIGDVGGSEREEIDHAPGPGLNFEWPIYEGDIPGPLTCAGVDSTLFRGPVYSYDHSQGAAVIGGVIYRRLGSGSSRFPPEYSGDIFFSDFYRPWLRRLKRTGNTWALAVAPGQPNATDWGFGPTWISDWLVAPDGALWYCRMLTGSGPGEIRRIRYTGTASVAESGPPRLEFRAPFPSPSRERVTLDYVLPAAGPVTLAIYDVGGRRVRTLAEHEPQVAGPRRVTWDCRDGVGRRTPSGVYRVRLSAVGRNLERRVVRVD